MNQQPLGFVAFWKATDRWFCADDQTKQMFMEKLRSVMDEARAKGV